MSEPENMTLRLLRSIDGKLDRVQDDLKDIKVRMTAVEEGLAGVNRRIDRTEGRLDRIERRLELVDVV
jgi:predicted nuclease with TOPRIM domain